MLSILNQPFPAPNRKNALRMAAALGLFVALFLLFFQPFGLAAVTPGFRKILAISGYGIVTFCCVAFTTVLLPKLLPSNFNAAKWQVKKEIGMTLLNFMLVGFFNMVYTFLVFSVPFNIRSLVYFQFITLAVGILPVSLVVLLRHNRLLAKNLKLAHEMNAGLNPELIATQNQPAQTPESPAMFTCVSETGNEQFQIPKADFLFAAAADNYVELHYIQNGTYKKNLIRSSLTKVEEAVKADPKVVRCHRTFLVNLNQVKHVSGNAQGLKLELHHTDFPVPVSRSMVPGIKALLHG